MMNTSISAIWLQKGHFDFSGQDGRSTTSQLIKENLRVALGLPKYGLRIAFYPGGMRQRHIYWWREGKVKYAEAQFVAAISKEHPVLSLGVSIEKGCEDAEAKRAGDAMDRRTWDWPRLVKGVADILSSGVPAVARTLNSPVQVRVWSRPRSKEGERIAWHT